MDVCLPAWLDDLPQEDQAAARARFLLRLAALHYSPAGQLKSLSTALDMHPNSLAAYDTISPELAVRLESLLGREKFPRSLFRPDLFLAEG
jgi:hypothetical protein